MPSISSARRSSSAATTRRPGPVLWLLAALLVAALLPAAIGRGAPARPAQVGATEGTYTLVETWPLPPAPPAPVDLALSPGGRLFVADWASRLVLIQLPGGAEVARWSAPAGIATTDRPAGPLSLALDTEHDRAYVLWASPAPRPLAGEYQLHLEVRRLSGESLALHPLATSRWADLAARPDLGDVLLLADGELLRVDPISGAQTLLVRSNMAVGWPMHLARPFPNQIAIASSGVPTLHIYTDAGVLRSNQALPGNRLPLALDSDGENHFVVLLSPMAPEEATAADPLVAVLGLDFALVTSYSGEALRAAPPRLRSWPWSITARAGHLAFTSGVQRFELHRQAPDGGLDPVVTGGQVRNFGAGDPLDTPGAAFSLSLTGDGRLVALDGRTRRIAAFAADGSSRVVGQAPEDAVDLAMPAAGDVAYVTTRSDRLERLAASPGVTGTWSVPCNCSLGGRLTLAGDYLYIGRPRDREVAAINIISQTGATPLSLPEAVGIWPSDVASDGQGRLYTADLVTGQVQVWPAPGAAPLPWPAGLLAGPRRMAAGQLADGTAVLVLAMADGFVELHGALDGNLLARWQPTDTEGEPIAVADLALAVGDRVYLADAKHWAVRVFEPRLVPTPTPVPNPTAIPTPSSLSCDVEGDKRAGPHEIVLGQTAAVTLTLSADCPVKTQIIGADILLVIDHSGSMSGNKLLAAKAAAKSFVELLDVRFHRVGLVAFSSEATVAQSLTVDSLAAMDAIDRLQATGGTNITAALTTADQELADRGRADALPVIILLTDGRHGGSGPPPLTAATQARNRGVQIYVIGLGEDVDEPGLRAIAGSAERYFSAPTPEELFPIYGQILRLVLSSLAGNLVLDDEMGPDIRYLPGSAHPLPVVGDERLQWGRSILPSSGITLTYRIQPQVPGYLPTNSQAVADYTDADGVRRQFVFPVPTIHVVTPSPTPTATPTNTPTPTPTSVPIHLPINYRGQCVPGIARADVVLLIDASSSMVGDKFTEAKRAARTFVGQLRLPADQAAVIAFHSGTTVATGLTGDESALRRAIDGLGTQVGTRIDLALAAADRELTTSPRRNPRNRPVVVLLSDGAQVGPIEEVYRAAATLRGKGTLVFTIGLGGDADAAMLRAVASPGGFYQAANAADLSDIYRTIAVLLPCR